ncbi:MAG: NUDIX hydrolase [Candidatus Eremiobacteraeota bacterium]|nr:NUDIX hydrolase [Candidatus Eremiobacteraeota bacterium]MBV8355918.1 NUDIX hydrolase [Candidatus Eremiobacteraeota bacterium]
MRRNARNVYENPWLRFEAHEVVHPSGCNGEYGVVVVPPVSGVVVMDGDDVVLTSQERYASGERVVEIVKGGAHAGESPLACAQRETREELGFVVEDWLELPPLYEIPSIVTGRVSLFLAKNCRFVGLAPEREETIDTVRMPLFRAVELALRGGIDDAVTVGALARAWALLRDPDE